MKRLLIRFYWCPGSMGRRPAHVIGSTTQETILLHSRTPFLYGPFWTLKLDDEICCMACFYTFLFSVFDLLSLFRLLMCIQCVFTWCSCFFIVNVAESSLPPPLWKKNSRSVTLFFCFVSSDCCISFSKPCLLCDLWFWVRAKEAGDRYGFVRLFYSLSLMLWLRFIGWFWLICVEPGYIFMTPHTFLLVHWHHCSYICAHLSTLSPLDPFPKGTTGPVLELFEVVPPSEQYTTFPGQRVQ